MCCGCGLRARNTNSFRAFQINQRSRVTISKGISEGSNLVSHTSILNKLRSSIFIFTSGCVHISLVRGYNKNRCSHVSSYSVHTMEFLPARILCHPHKCLKLLTTWRRSLWECYNPLKTRLHSESGSCINLHSCFPNIA